MSLDFFNNTCSENSRNNTEFGLCDDVNDLVAYSNSRKKKNWIAIVKNDKKKEIIFTPIDNCIIKYKENSKDKESTCDGMLTFQDSVYLVELKNVRTAGWIQKAIDQLKNTTRLIENNQFIKQRYKKAFACNIKKSRFITIDNELKKKFFIETNGFRLDVNRTIKIK
jgi:hypothetical protein